MLFIILLKWRVLGANLKVVSGNEARKKTPNKQEWKRDKTEKDVIKRNELETQTRLHKLKAKAFYSILKSDDNNAIFITFGC